MSNENINVFDVVKAGCLITVTVSVVGVCWKACEVLSSVQNLADECTRVGQNINYRDVQEIIGNVKNTTRHSGEMLLKVRREGIPFVLAKDPNAN